MLLTIFQIPDGKLQRWSFGAFDTTEERPVGNLVGEGKLDQEVAS